MYTMAKPLYIGKHQEQATEDDDSEGNGSPLYNVVRKILDQSGLGDVIINSRILKRMGTQISKVMKLAKKVMRSGGKPLKALVTKWQPEKSNYKFKVYFHETDKVKMKTEIEKLRAENKDLESDICQKNAKILKLSNSASYWKKRFKTVVEKMIRKQRKSGGFRNKSKPFSEYSLRHKRRVKSELKSECQVALDFLGLYELIPTKVEYYNHLEGSYEMVNLVDESELDSSLINDDSTEVRDEITDEQLDNVFLMLYVKDKFQISDKAWQDLSVQAKDLPSKYSIKKRIELLNTQWNVFPTPGAAEGVQMKLKDSLMEQTSWLLKDKKLNNCNSLKIKVSGDGTRIGKRLQLLNVTYTIINEGKLAMSEKENYVLAVIKTKDDYTGIRDSLSDLRDEMKKLDSITCENRTFKIEYFLGGDWKFLATVCGLGPANQDFACIWFGVSAHVS